MKKHWLADLMTNQYKQAASDNENVDSMQFNVMPWTSLGVDTV